MLEISELTRIENGDVVGAMSPVLFVKEFCKTCKIPLARKIWRIHADMSFKDGGETGTADLLLTLISGGHLLILVDFGVGGRCAAVQWYGDEPEMIGDWRSDEEFYNAPTDDELGKVLKSIDVDAELAEIKSQLEQVPR